MKHIHHIIPRHVGGTDDSTNLVELTIEEHAEAHKILYEEHGRWQDRLAWKGLAGLIGSDEITEEYYKFYRGENHHMFGVKRPEHAKLMSEKFKGENNPAFGKTPWNKGLTYSTGPNAKKAHPGNEFGKGNKGKIQSEEWKKKRLDKIKGPHETSECPHCKVIGGERIMKRWHFDNCRLVNNKKV